MEAIIIADSWQICQAFCLAQTPRKEVHEANCLEMLITAPLLGKERGEFVEIMR